MRFSLPLVAAALLALTGCDTTNRATTNSSTAPSTVARPSYDSAASSSPAGDGDTRPSTLAPASTDNPGVVGPSSAEPDNTAVNERDRDASTKTPIDQNENQRDINITAEIRKAVVAHADMSINGRNVKIITADGKVTLRGPVNSDAEKKVIDDIAKNVAGKENVTNQIEVKADN